MDNIGKVIVILDPDNQEYITFAKLINRVVYTISVF